MQFRNYDPSRDRPAANRIHLEVGWLESGHEASRDLLNECARALVCELNGEAECIVSSAPGFVRYLDEDLPFAGVTGVATSRVARRQSIARRLCAAAVAADAQDGIAVEGLCIFDQGFYNQLGFGTGSYELDMTFDPSQLRLDVHPRVPRRITPDDWQAVHASRLARMRGHGGIAFTPPEVTRENMLEAHNGFGLGYYDGPNGELTHHLWMWAKNVGSGPYNVGWMTYQNWDQFLELMGLLRNMSDQVCAIRMNEPPGVQLQDLLTRPFRHRQTRDGSGFENNTRVAAYWQKRINNVSACLAKTHLRSDDLRFNLSLSDPIERFLDAGSAWRGVAGDFVVTLGKSSGAELGRDASLPTLTASVNAFTRMWLGVRPATSLTVTDELSGPAELLQELDWALRLPQPRIDWNY